MRKLSRFFVLFLFTGLLAAYTPASIADHQTGQSSYGSKVGNKALNAFANLATAPLEIPKNMINTSNKSNVFYGIVGGLFKGLVHTAGRLGVGIADLITIPLPTKPIAQPAYIWDDFDVDTTYGPAFRLDNTQEIEQHVVEAPVPAPVATTVVAPRPAAIDNSKLYNQEANQKLDTFFKKEMKK
jgi:putative exosortase-associated protein (TIGR04073 family)